MHSIPGGRDLHDGRVYHEKEGLTRPNSLPYIFRKLRIAQGLCQEGAAVKLDVPTVYLAAFESGHLVPSLRFCLAYGYLFGFNSNWIKVKWVDWVSGDFRSKLLEATGLDD